jgi:hypothetical protein
MGPQSLPSRASIFAEACQFIPSNMPPRRMAYPINIPGTYTIAVMVIAWIPIPIDSPRWRFLFFMAYRKPVISTMKDAPSLEPESMVNVWSLVSVPAPNRLIAVAATGEPDNTK